MKRPLYYLLCAIACTSMVSSTLPMPVIAEAMQPRATAEQQAQAAAANGDAGKAEDGANTNATADTVEDSTATSTGTTAANTESADGTPRCNRHPRPIPPRPNQPHARGNLHHVTNHLRPLRHRKPKRRHLHRLVERRPRGHRDDLPRNPGQRLVPGQGAHGRAHLLGRRQP